ARRPDVDEAPLLHRASDRGDDRGGQSHVALHRLAAEIEVAVAEAQRLLHALLVELERQRLRARHDLELVDLQLHLARRDVRVHGGRGALDQLTAGAEDELVANLVRGRRCVGGVLRVDHELDDPRVVAQVDEDEAAVVAAPRGPAGDRQPTTLVRGAELPAIDISPVAHPAIASTRVSRGAIQSSRPCSRTVARPSSTITVQPAPSREAWVSWPFADRPA